MIYKNNDKLIDKFQVQLVSFDSFIPEDSIVRVIDAFVDALDMSKFSNYYYKGIGQRAYNPSTLLKIYLLGYHRHIRSSRRLEHALLYDIEFIWISNGQKIKHSTIADFRKVNHDLLKDVMFNFNLSLYPFDLISNSDSNDGTKVKAVNSKDKNFTQSKLDDRIKNIKEKIELFEKDFDFNDNNDDEKERLQEEISVLRNRLNEYKDILKDMEKNKLSQVSLTDPDSKLMRNNGKFEVCYNNQVEVDSKSHIVKNFMLSSSPADFGNLSPIALETKDVYNIDILTNSTDKGYNDRNDMINCLENGIIPEVTPSDDKDGFELQTDFEDNIISDDDLKSTKPEDIKKCLRAGKIPNVYKDVISDIEVKDVYVTNYDTVADDGTSLEEKRDYAIKNNCFVRDLKSNKVFCPCGEILRQKSCNRGKNRYCNKLACKHCKNPCTTASYKIVDFSPNQILSGKTVKKFSDKNKKRTKVKKVIIKTKSNFEVLKDRMAISEHPHGSMKFWDDCRYLLMKGIEKATGEVALYYTAYNIRRVCNLIDKKLLIEYYKGIKDKKVSYIY